MPHKYPVLTPKQIIKILRKHGFVEISQSGSHKKMSDGKHITIVPMHDKDIKKGTLVDIIYQSGLPLEVFCEN